MAMFGHIATLAALLALVQAAPLAGSALADDLRSFRYIGEGVVLPSSADFADGFQLSNNRRVSGTAYKCGDESCTTQAFVYHHGAPHVLADDSFAVSANDSGLIGGGVLTDSANFFTQAALLREGQRPRLIPRLPNEVTSFVKKVTSSGVALVFSFNANFDLQMYYYKNGAIRFITLPPEAVINDVNDRGQIAGNLGLGRAFRFDPWNNSLTTLNPLPTERNSWGMAINNAGDVLGYSFEFSSIERIGYWRNQTFRTVFVEGTPEYPTISNNLLWNERGLIVITRTRNPDRTSGDSYLVPAVGVRLKLSDITTPSTVVNSIVDINDNGDMISEFGLILKRVGEHASDIAAPPTPSISTKSQNAFAKPCPKKLAETLSKRPPVARGSTSLSRWCGA